MTDQQRADSIGAFGNPVAQTPNLDAMLAKIADDNQISSVHATYCTEAD